VWAWGWARGRDGFQNEWFPHLVSSDLTPAEQSAILAQSFEESSRHRPGPPGAPAVSAAAAAAAAGFEVVRSSVEDLEGGRYSFTTRYKLRHDVEQLEHIAHMHAGPTRAWLNAQVLPCFRKVRKTRART